MRQGKNTITKCTSACRECYNQMSESTLILACRNGDPVAFDVLVRRYRGTVIGLLYQLAPEKTDTADLVQEVFIRVWRSIGTLRSPFAFKSWLSHVVTNLFYDELRKRPPAIVFSMDEVSKDENDESITRELPDLSHLPDELNQQRELEDAIEDAMEKLPGQFRTVLFLREFDGLSYEQIAALTHTELGTVKSRISRARSRVQELLTPFLNSAA